MPAETFAVVQGPVPWIIDLTSRSGIPDEPVVRVDVVRDDVVVATLRVWEGDVDRYPAIQRFLERAREIVQELSGGRAVL
jgi:hypothetical protein